MVEGLMQIHFVLLKTLSGRGECWASMGLDVAEGVPQPDRLLFYFKP